MDQLHYAAMIDIACTTDDPTRSYEIERYHARRHEQRAARRERHRRVVGRLRVMRPSRTVRDVVIAAR